jgi:hypothetical protein
VIDPEVLAAAAAVRLNVPAADLLESANAALEYIAADISGSTADLDPADALLMVGARLLTERIYQDVSTRTGDLDALGTLAMSGVLVPEDLGRHLRHYWTPVQHSWGIA